MSLDALSPMTDDEINAFFDEVDQDRDGFVTFQELAAVLATVHTFLTSESTDDQSSADSSKTPSENDFDHEKGRSSKYQLNAFLSSLVPNAGPRISRLEIIEHVRRWNVPSPRQTSAEAQQQLDASLERRLPASRRLKAHWDTDGSKMVFMSFVVVLSLAMLVWQMVEYILKPDIRAALGWGVILAKATAGALYPLLFFLILSMSRHLATFCRRWRLTSRIVNWDRSQAFHVKISLLALLAATVHSVGHLAGSFWYGSRAGQQDDLRAIHGWTHMSYRDFIRTTPGWTGLAALACFYLIAMTSMPIIRRRSFELFQLGHSLIFVLIGLLYAHGTARILQAPMLGYWVAIPTLVVFLERVHRLARGLVPIYARLQILDENTVRLTARSNRGSWHYQAGQYVLLQVPEISFFQWHPFTVSACREGLLQVHIKTTGDWTRRLRSLPLDREVRIGVDGPFGAPAQTFREYEKAIVIGSGIGITPFAAIVADLEQQAMSIDPASDDAQEKVQSDLTGQRNALSSSSASDGATVVGVPVCKPKRRVDFHWLVRNKADLLWFSDLLNRASDWANPSQLELNINTHITGDRCKLSIHVFWYLLDRYRTQRVPYSPLTGLRTESKFGRPDLRRVLEDFHGDLAGKANGGEREKGRGSVRVGVFFCGASAIGTVLADECRRMTRKAREDGSNVKYEFRMEVFN